VRRECENISVLRELAAHDTAKIVTGKGPIMGGGNPTRSLLVSCQPRSDLFCLWKARHRNGVLSQGDQRSAGFTACVEQARKRGRRDMPQGRFALAGYHKPKMGQGKRRKAELLWERAALEPCYVWRLLQLYAKRQTTPKRSQPVTRKHTDIQHATCELGHANHGRKPVTEGGLRREKQVGACAEQATPGAYGVAYA